MMVRAALVLLFVSALTVAARSFVVDGASVTGSGSGAALALGFLLIAALQVGHLFHGLHLPHITGFILCGVMVGPEVLGLVTPLMLRDLSLVKGVAVGLIALIAGCELNLRALRPRLRSIAAFSLGSMVVAGALLWLLFFIVASVLPVTRDMTLAERATVALVCANVFCAFSPAVVIGIIAETKAKGPLAELCVSIVVLADLAIVLSFAMTSSLVDVVFPGQAASAGAAALTLHLFGSVAVGAALGVVLSLYMQRVGQRVGLFIFGVLFFIAEAGRLLHIDPLLVGLVAGLFLENISPVSGHRVVSEAKSASLPTLALFFAVVGAQVHLHEFLRVAPYAVLLALTRAAGIYWGARLGARVADTPAPIARLVPLGLLPQAGVAIALAALLKSSFGAWGEAFGTLILGAIVLNELIGPALFRAALNRAGEATA